MSRHVSLVFVAVGILGLTACPGVEPADETLRTIGDVLADPNLTIGDVALETRVPSLSLAPSNILLGTAELDLRDRTGKELVLGEKLRMESGRGSVRRFGA